MLKSIHSIGATILALSMFSCAQNKINLQTQVKGVLPTTNGGTGTTTPGLIAGSNISITGNWPNQTITASVSGTTAITSPTALQTAPPGTLTNECPSTNGNNPFWWIQDVNGNYHTQASIDTFSDDTSGPTSPGGSLLFCRHVFFNDTKNSPTPFKNSLVSIAHTTGTGTANGNQDRALSVFHGTPSGDTGTHYAIEGIQAELDINGTPTFNGSPDGEATAGSFQLADFHSGTLSGPTNYGVNAIRAEVFREVGGGNWGSCSGCWSAVRAIATNVGTVAGNGQPMVAVYAQIRSLTPGVTNQPAIAIFIPTPTQRFSANTGISIQDFGTNTADRNILSSGSMANSSGINDFRGPVLLSTRTPASATDACVTGTITWDSGFIYVCIATNSWARAAIAAW